ncbi:MAG: hypothetical protein A3G18_11015 [Rhodospirillales bacterium RIFCSPLOWO2_12_FULL_58_28]|nr:MAG: hypothetical protein A3H92_03555 [Rhodospirillales bacterium RIFCSPLOWO2_02_FULL_58_16]OHC77735.1 MAG: hypothetical protein A3G18_11015 [Rhodospirillales bacterium RIFCSPLOWO2_12_FULL_58_28]
MTIMRKYREAWVCLSSDAADWANVMLGDVSDGLSALGYKTTKLFFDERPGRHKHNQELFNNRVKTEEPFVIIDFNATTNMKPDAGIPDAEIPKRFSIVCDNPCDHLDKLVKTWGNSILGMVDRQHLAVLDAIGVNRQKVFFPHGGPPPPASPLPMKDRDIDILFSGLVYPHPKSETWIGQTGNLPKILKTIADEAAARVIEERKSVFRSFADSCAANSFNPADLDIKSLCLINSMIDVQAVTTQRHEVISRLKDMNLHIVGRVIKGDGGLDLSNVTTHGRLTFSAVIELMKRSKIVLNITPKFSDGSHERIWYGMANGAVILTNYSHFLAETFTDGENICFLPGDIDRLAAGVSELLKDHKKADEMAGAAMPVYIKSHTWKERVKIIDDALNAADPD